MGARLKMSARQARRVLQLLEGERLVEKEMLNVGVDGRLTKKRQRDESETKVPVAPNEIYWYVDLRKFCDVIRWRVHLMRETLKKRETAATRVSPASARKEQNRTEQNRTPVGRSVGRSVDGAARRARRANVAVARVGRRSRSDAAGARRSLAAWTPCGTPSSAPSASAPRRRTRRSSKRNWTRLSRCGMTRRAPKAREDRGDASDGEKRSRPAQVSDWRENPRGPRRRAARELRGLEPHRPLRAADAPRREGPPEQPTVREPKRRRQGHPRVL